MSDPADLSITEARAALDRRELSAEELTTACLRRIEERNSSYHAFVHVDADRALDAARRADRDIAAGESRGPLHGIPVGVKDLFDTADMPTTRGSGVFAGHRPAVDADLVARLRTGGAVVVGKLDTYEFAMVGPVFDRPAPPARNPWNLQRFTGGSSSGSASAVAGGLVRTALGTDTGGSVRSPSSYCGAVGFKPTYGALSLEGVFPLTPSFDHAGILSASVDEALLTYHALSDAEPRQVLPPKRDDLRNVAIGYARDWFAADPQLHPAVLSAMDEAASQLSLLGAKIVEVALPEAALFEAAGAVIIHAEAYDIHRTLLAEKGDTYSRKVFQNILSGLLLTPEDVDEARRASNRLCAQIDAHLDGRFDALLTVNTLTPAFSFADFETDVAVWTPMRTLAFNMSGHPVFALPAGFCDGLPLGLQLIGRRHGEAELGAIARAYEASTDFASLRPPLPAGVLR
ncbi:amidase [Rhizobium sp. G21]|uniref:amidase n=1 Tax=Rhizobium sp. G21 TaxID=2758439 RepID=UPI001AEDF698|nr:amidase [Rhizobium sp. G21]